MSLIWQTIVIVVTLIIRKGDCMERVFLETLGIDKDNIEKIMKEHGKSVQASQDHETLKKENLSYIEQIKSLQSELAGKDEKVTTVEKEKNDLLNKVHSFEKKELKIRVAREHNIPFELASRLQGETEEELGADALSLSSLVSKKEVLPLKQEVDKESKDEEFREMLDSLNKA